MQVYNVTESTEKQLKYCNYQTKWFLKPADPLENMEWIILSIAWQECTMIVPYTK